MLWFPYRDKGGGKGIATSRGGNMHPSPLYRVANRGYYWLVSESERIMWIVP